MKQPFNILLIGDACVDEYHYGNVSRLNPEAPVPVFNYLYKEVKGGMADNVYNNLRAFGLNVGYYSPEEKSIKVRYIDKKSMYQMLRVDYDKVVKEPFRVEDIDLSIYDAIVISDYNKGYVDYKTVVDIQDVFDGPIYIDSKKEKLALFDKCFVKINEQEANAAVSMPENTIVTLGARGASYKDEIIETEPTEVFDVCGAGDTFLAALVYSHLNYGDIRMAIRFANLAAGISCKHHGVYSLTEEDIEQVRSQVE